MTRPDHPLKVHLGLIAINRDETKPFQQTMAQFEIDLKVYRLVAISLKNIRMIMKYSCLPGANLV